MTNVLHWRKTTWVILLWGAYVPTWAVITGSGPGIVALWWLAGATVFGVLWLGTQLLLRQGSAFSGIVSWPPAGTGASSTFAEPTGPRSAGAPRVEAEPVHAILSVGGGDTTSRH